MWNGVRELGAAQSRSTDAEAAEEKVFCYEETTVIWFVSRF